MQYETCLVGASTILHAHREAGAPAKMQYATV
jgi:hypothetical protein